MGVFEGEDLEGVLDLEERGGVVGEEGGAAQVLEGLEIGN